MTRPLNRTQAKRTMPCPRCAKPSKVVTYDAGFGVYCSGGDCWEGPVLDTEDAAVAEWNRVATSTNTMRQRRVEVV